MSDFECHYRHERWETEQYFNFVEDLFRAANSEDFSYECDPPPCPSTPGESSCINFMAYVEVIAFKQTILQESYQKFNV